MSRRLFTSESVTEGHPDKICDQISDGVLDALLANRVRRICVLLPYDKLGQAQPMRQRGTVLAEEYRPDGLFLDGIVKVSDLHLLAPYLLEGPARNDS